MAEIELVDRGGAHERAREHVAARISALGRQRLHGRRLRERDRPGVERGGDGGRRPVERVVDGRPCRRTRERHACGRLELRRRGARRRCGLWQVGRLHRDVVVVGIAVGRPVVERARIVVSILDHIVAFRLGGRDRTRN